MTASNIRHSKKPSYEQEKVVPMPSVADEMRPSRSHSQNPHTTPQTHQSADEAIDELTVTTASPPLDTPLPELLKIANRAGARFRLAGNQLHVTAPKDEALRPVLAALKDSRPLYGIFWAVVNLMLPLSI